MNLAEHSPAITAAPAPRLHPLLWHDCNLLFLPREKLSDALRELCRSLPLEVRPPLLSRETRGAFDETIQAHPDDERGQPLDGVAFLLATSRELSLLAKTEGGRLADAALWCELLAPNGWLNAPPAEAASLFGVSEGTFLRALSAAQRAVEPPGLFARNASECLLLQLDAQGGRGCDAGTLLTEGKDALESGASALENFRAEKGWPPARLKEALARLRRLDPAPGRSFSLSPPVRPELDFYLSQDGRGEQAVCCRLARENLPHLSLASEDLMATLAKKEWTRAKSLLTRLGLRYRTLLRIGLFLAERQAEYLGKARARETLAPVGLKEIARATGLHESTVSRCLANTWARSPAGTLRLSSLLSRSLGGGTGAGKISYGELKAILRDALERGANDAVVAEETGIPRRTLTYHRKRLGIPSSRVKGAR